MKIGILTVAFGDERFIGAAINQFKNFPVHKHLVMCSSVPWNGDAKPDNTAQIAKDLGVWVTEKEWRDENQQRQEGLEALQAEGVDWTLIVDADEYYTQEGLKTLFDFLPSADKQVYRSGLMEVYWKDWDTVIRPPSGTPVLAMRPNVRFSNIRDVAEERFYLPPEVMTHHLSYCRTDSEIWDKIHSWGHSHEIRPSWYEDIWMKWKPGNQDFHPTCPSVFHDSARYPLPQEIKELLGWNLKKT